MWVLTAGDIEKAISYPELVDGMEEAFRIYESGKYLMPNRMHLTHNSNTLLVMPCIAGNEFGTKLVSVFPENRSKNLPVIQGAVILNNGETGEPIALLNGPKLTAMRTAAVGSVGVRYLSPSDSDSLGIIGVGIQGTQQALAACSQRPIRNLYIYSRNKPSMDRFIADTSPLIPNVSIHQLKSAEEVVKKSQIVITATTSQTPVLPDDHNLLAGKCFIGVGSFKPDMAEFPPALYGLLEQIFIDTEFAEKESGDLAIPLKNGILANEKIQTMAELVTGNIQLSKSETTCFKSVGMALFDLVAAKLVYHNARNHGLGSQIEL